MNDTEVNSCVGVTNNDSQDSKHTRCRTVLWPSSSPNEGGLVLLSGMLPLAGMVASTVSTSTSSMGRGPPQAWIISSMSDRSCGEARE